MAVNIFDKYGIKEVANVYFEALADDLNAGVYKGDIVLFLDTLKVSTIETTAESVDATGGWGNAKLVSWDFGKEITITLTDALISLESLRFMMGGAIKQNKQNTDKIYVRHTAEFVLTDAGKVPLIYDNFYTNHVMTPTATPGHDIRLIDLDGGYRTQIVVETGSSQLTENATITFHNPALIGEGADIVTGTTGADGKIVGAGHHIRAFWEEEVTTATDEQAVEITISPSTFPGSYRVVGDTFMRSQATGKDEPFQFVINNAKVSSEVTITLEAEGDPSTFDMNLSVLRSKNAAGQDEMIKFVRYNFGGGTSSAEENDHGSIAGGSQ